jgi:DNA-binding MarR family transcriptional regulator
MHGNEAGLDAVLARIDSMAIAATCLPVISVGLAGLDDVYAGIEVSRAIILCDADERDLAAAMLIALRRTENNQRLDDIGRESEGERLERLTDELSRLAQTIEALVQERQPVRGRSARSGTRRKRGNAIDQDGVAGRDVLLRSPESDFAALPVDADLDEGGLQPIDAQQVRSVLRARRLRDHIFAPDLFADPAWDIMLDLMAAHLEGTLVSVSSLCIAAAVPPTTALRWIRQLTDRGLLCRQADPDDGRRIFITLSEEGLRAIHRWFAASRTHLLQASGGEA